MKIKPVHLLTVTTSLLLLSAFSQTNTVRGASANHIIISEIQVGAGDNDFVELYNPTDSNVSLSGWRLSKKVNSETSLVASMSGTIASKGYFLISNKDGSASPSADLTYASSIADNNTILLYSDAGTSLIDKVGMGTALDFESTQSATPANGKSIERKANSASNANSMMITGTDEFMGNAEDTDNNGVDFVLREIPEPQNSQSTHEPIATATPSPTATATATVTPTITPTNTPTSSPTPTVSPTATPTATATVTPTVTPTATPTASTTPSATPSSTPQSTIFPSPFEGYSFQCKVTYHTFRSRWFFISVPQIFCGLVKNK